MRALVRPDCVISTVRGREPGNASVARIVRASSETLKGGRSRRPCEKKLRRRSTGSPPAPRSRSDRLLGEVGRAGIGDLGIGQDVDYVRLAGVERALEGRGDVVGLRDELALSSEGLHQLVVTDAGSELGRDVVSAQRAHRVFLEPPDAVVAD